MLRTSDPDLLNVVETYLDATPRSAATAEEVGNFTLFRPLGQWRYYARPRRGLDAAFTVSDVDALRVRQRELELPENIEWMLETTPSLAAAAAESGLNIVVYPLMVLEAATDVTVTAPDGSEIRPLSADDPDFGLAHAVASVGFRASGTEIGTEGADERDERAAEASPALVEFQRSRARDGWSVSYAAFDDRGPVAVGTHQPVGDVTEIVGVATLPAARRRGLGTAVTAALVADAQARGVTTVFLSAGSDDGARIYERVGFRRIGSVGSAEPEG